MKQRVRQVWSALADVELTQKLTVSAKLRGIRNGDALEEAIQMYLQKHPLPHDVEEAVERLIEERVVNG